MLVLFNEEYAPLQTISKPMDYDYMHAVRRLNEPFTIDDVVTAAGRMYSDYFDDTGEIISLTEQGKSIFKKIS